jgi:ribose 5-phosphate isomerase RpiB
MSFLKLNAHFDRLISQSHQAKTHLMSLAHETAGNNPAPNLVTTVTNTPNGAHIAVKRVVGAHGATVSPAQHANMMAEKLRESSSIIVKKVIK